MLQGLKIIECGEMVSAAYAAKLMADLGAEVIKVEPPGIGDRARRRGPFPLDTPCDSELSGLFTYLNANKLGISLELHHAKGREIFRQLLKDADVLIHNFPISLCESLDLTYPALALHNARLIVTQITTFGASGPHSRFLATDLVSMAAGGWAYLSPGGLADPSQPPLKAFGEQAEFQGGVHAAVATMGALFARRRLGRGQLVDVSVQECIAAALELALVKYTYRDEISRRYGTFTPVMTLMRCKDGPIFVMILEDEQWRHLCNLIGNPEWTNWEIFRNREGRSANLDLLRDNLEEWLKQHTVASVFKLAGEAKLPFAPVSTMAEILELDHLKQRNFFRLLNHPAAGMVACPGPPYKLEAPDWQLRCGAPLLGQHNEEIYSRLGVSRRDLGGLRTAGVI